MTTLRLNIPIDSKRISDYTHPEYNLCIRDWEKWRLVYNSGDDFIEEYTKRFSSRESNSDFIERKQITPIPAFAKGAIDEIKNAIFQRTTDITREGGPETYRLACLGQLGGIDLKGGTMNWLIGHYILPELLTMRKVGVFVDNQIIGPSLADKGNKHPYLYVYKAEDIRCWSYYTNGSGIREYTSLLLRDYYYDYDNKLNLPTEQKTRFRHLFIKNNRVNIQYYDDEGSPYGSIIELKIQRIPFACFEINDSLLKNVANHQIALLNLESSDINFALRSNFPFYTEQYDHKNNTDYLKAAQEAAKELNCDTTELASNNEVELGISQGRRYGLGLERPGFIHPSPEPLKASMEKQTSLKEDIRNLVHLALSNIQPKMASAESKALDQHGLEAGLSYIGLELEHGERQLADYWAMYEGSSQKPTVIYPKKYSLKTDKQIYDEVATLENIRDSIPSTVFQKEISKQIVTSLLATKVSSEKLDQIYKEIDQASVITSDPDILHADIEAGLLSRKTGSKARGYPESESDTAKMEHAERLALIQKAQTSPIKNPKERGLPDLAG